MTTAEVAKTLIEKCRMGQNMEVLNELYANSILSIEPPHSQAERTEGIDAVAKNLNNGTRWWKKSTAAKFLIRLLQEIIFRVA